MRYNIEIAFTCNGEITIEAKTKKEALEKARATKEELLKEAGSVRILGKEFTADAVTVKDARKAAPTKELPGKLTVYTDGGYHLYKNEGAYAYVILDRGMEIAHFAKAVRKESNNRCELHAIIEAVKACPANADLTIRSDSQYAINTLDGKWNRNTNLDLFEDWNGVLKEKHPKITFQWVRGHNGDKWNERCDRLCDEAVGYDLNAWTNKFKKK